MQDFQNAIETIFKFLPEQYEMSFDSEHKSVTVMRRDGVWIVWLGQRFPTMKKYKRLAYIVKHVVHYLQIKEKVTNET